MTWSALESAVSNSFLCFIFVGNFLKRREA
jgi:hypothetical protein